MRERLVSTPSMIIQVTKKPSLFQQTVYFPKKSRLHDFVNNIVLNKLSEDSFITTQCTASRCDLLSYETKKKLKITRNHFDNQKHHITAWQNGQPKKMIQMRKPSFTQTIIPNIHKISGMRIDSQKKKSSCWYNLVKEVNISRVSILSLPPF